MKRHAVRALIVLVTMAVSSLAQTAPKAAAEETGFTSSVEFDGTSNSEGQIYELTTSAGYDFSHHFGADVGMPFYFIRASSSAGGTSTNGIGNPFVDLRVKYLNPAVNFGSTLTGFAPIADSKKGLSTGRGTFDWTNHFDHSFDSLKPFADIGIANTIVGTKMFIRPYTTLGFNTHFQGGATYDIWKFFSVGASAYDILPVGQQTVFSRVAHGTSSHGRVFENNQQTKGSADIAKDDGFSTWVEASPGKVVDLQLGFTRSMHYDLNSVSFGIGFNLKELYNRHAQ